MGLDITAYRQLKLAPDAQVDEDGNPKEWDKFLSINAAVLEWTVDNFPGRADDLSPGVYSFAESHDFRAGSYGGYGVWRNWLAERAGHKSARHVWENVSEGPFVELIHFADNEGYIGPAVSAKLAKDFAEHEEKILAAGDEPWNADLYRAWRRAFEMAADGGCVDFH